MHQVYKLHIMAFHIIAFLSAGKWMDGYFEYPTEPKLGMGMMLQVFTLPFFFLTAVAVNKREYWLRRGSVEQAYKGKMQVGFIIWLYHMNANMEF